MYIYDHPKLSFSIPAQAAITPLSVHKLGGGNINSIPELINSLFVNFFSSIAFSFLFSNNFVNRLIKIKIMII